MKNRTLVIGIVALVLASLTCRGFNLGFGKTTTEDVLNPSPVVPTEGEAPSESGTRVAPSTTPHAQQQTITGIGTIYYNNRIPLTITFAPAGGQVSGSSIYHGPVESFTEEGGCNGSQTITMSGTFAGGNWGLSSGTLILEIIIEEPCKASTLTFTGTWEGNFSADGYGNGTLQVNFLDFTDFLTESVLWQVTYLPDEFQAALSTPIP